MPHFAGVELAPETMQRTREHFAGLCQSCIDGAKGGTMFVNDVESYVAWQERNRAHALEGKSDHTFTFLQRAHYLQTGVDVPLLSPRHAR